MNFVIVMETSSVLGEKDQLETLYCNLRAMYSACIQETGKIDEMYTDSILVNREFNKTTTAIATGTSLNKFLISRTMAVLVRNVCTFLCRPLQNNAK